MEVEGNLDNLFQGAFALTIATTIIFCGLLIWRRFNQLLTVNCWFCNQDSKVKHCHNNAWLCSNCGQYNGFQEDGDYNDTIKNIKEKELYSQHQTNYTARDPSPNTHQDEPKFCKTCQNNQVLKVKQLAAFSPLNPYNFDAEVDQFSNRLDVVYALCKRCKNKVDSHLEKQNKILKNQLSSLGGLPISKTMNHKKKRTCNVCIIYVLTFLCVMLILLVIATRIKSYHRSPSELFKSLSVTHIAWIVSSSKYIVELKDYFLNLEIPVLPPVQANYYWGLTVLGCSISALYLLQLFFKRKPKSSAKFPKFKKSTYTKTAPKYRSTMCSDNESDADSEMEVDQVEENDQKSELDVSMSLLGIKRTEPQAAFLTPPPSNQSSIVSSMFEKPASTYTSTTGTLKNIPSDRSLPFRRYASTLTSHNLVNRMGNMPQNRNSQARSFINPAKLNIRSFKRLEHNSTPKAYVHSTKSEIGFRNRNISSPKLNSFSSRSVLTSPYTRTSQWLQMQAQTDHINATDVAEETNSSRSCSWEENKSDVSVHDSASQINVDFVKQHMLFKTPPKQRLSMSSHDSPKSIFSSVSMKSIKDAEDNRVCCWLLVFVLALNLMLIGLLYQQIKGMQQVQANSRSQW